MNDDLRVQLEQISEQLNAALRNQLLMYEKLERLEKMLQVEKQV